MNKRAHLLVIDDDPLNRLVLENTLSEEFDIRLCSCADEAWLVLDNDVDEVRIDLILLDVLMGEGAGYHVLERLKASHKTYSIPVIILSQSHSFHDEAKALELGALDYVTKPFSPAIIKARVKNHLAIKKKNDLLERLANIDGLTEIPNRRALEEVFGKLWLQAKKNSHALAFLLVNIDYFRAYNDKHGYAAGDACLVKVAHVLQEVTRHYGGFVARFDGVRFAVVLNVDGLESTLQFAQALELMVEDLKIPHQASPICAFISISMGGIVVVDNFTATPVEIYAQADEALRKAHQLQAKLEIVSI
ncbi:diguanylate cyclase domain-containing protein [Pseudoalteromonas fenneropenaei]|uniref:diguanylate cyclase n=1 Tax=Pseudoalteromonas fenneropenaei TaxID=1737459 RepID=A0ABV7CLA3_9GAMM